MSGVRLDAWHYVLRNEKNATQYMSILHTRNVINPLAIQRCIQKMWWLSILPLSGKYAKLRAIERQWHNGNQEWKFQLLTRFWVPGPQKWRKIGPNPEKYCILVLVLAWFISCFEFPIDWYTTWLYVESFYFWPYFGSQGPWNGENGPKSGKIWPFGPFNCLFCNLLRISDRLIYNMTICWKFLFLAIFGSQGP